jgi:hypothetical protein
MEMDPCLDLTETTTPSEPAAETVTTLTVEPTWQIGPPRSNRIWWLTGLLALMSVAAIIENIVFHEPNLVGSIDLKKGDRGPAGIFSKDAPLGPNGKGLAKGRGRGMPREFSPGDSSPKETANGNALEVPKPPVFDSRSPDEKKADEKAALDEKAAEEKKAAEGKKTPNAPATAKPAEPKPAGSPVPSPKE